MAQAEALETVFWKDANLRKVWDDTVPGAPRATIPYALTREAIELYCTPADDWMRSPGTVNAGQSWSYNIPARPNDVIRLKARALDKFIRRERLFVVHDNVFFNQYGDVICSGRGWTIRPE